MTVLSQVEKVSDTVRSSPVPRREGSRVGLLQGDSTGFMSIPGEGARPRPVRAETDRRKRAAQVWEIVMAGEFDALDEGDDLSPHIALLSRIALSHDLCPQVFRPAPGPLEGALCQIPSPCRGMRQGLPWQACQCCCMLCCGAQCNRCDAQDEGAFPDLRNRIAVNPLYRPYPCPSATIFTSFAPPLPSFTALHSPSFLFIPPHSPSPPFTILHSPH